jgi:hypothetical protein
MEIFFQIQTNSLNFIFLMNYILISETYHNSSTRMTDKSKEAESNELLFLFDLCSNAGLHIIMEIKLAAIKAIHKT